MSANIREYEESQLEEVRQSLKVDQDKRFLKTVYDELSAEPGPPKVF
jgi:hypothetical protein